MKNESIQMVKDIAKVCFGMTLLIACIVSIFYFVIHIDNSDIRNVGNSFVESKAYRQYREKNRKQICKQISQGSELVFECTYQYPSKAEFDEWFYSQNATKDTQ